MSDVYPTALYLGGGSRICMASPGYGGDRHLGDFPSQRAAKRFLSSPELQGFLAGRPGLPVRSFLGYQPGPIRPEEVPVLREAVNAYLSRLRHNVSHDTDSQDRLNEANR